MSQPGRSVIAAFVRSLTGVTVRWMGGRPDTRQTIYFANHTSHLDFVVLWSVLPPEVRTLTRPVAAKDYWQSGLRRRIAVGVFNAVLVERGGGPEGGRLQAVKHSLDVLLEALSAKNSLIIFPEGTRGTGETVARFKSGIYRLWCKRPDVLFVPVYLANLNRILPKGEVLPVPVISRAVFGQPLALQAHETKESFLEKAHAAVCALRQA